jgi:hypothetical protein
MPTFEIETIEQWEYEVHYRVDAPTIEEAIRKILSGGAEYDQHELRERSPKEEAKQIVRVTDEATGMIIEGQRKLRRLFRETTDRKPEALNPEAPLLIPSIPVEQIPLLPKGTWLHCTVLHREIENGIEYCSRFRLSVLDGNQMLALPVSKLEGYGIFDDGDGCILAADNTQVLVTDLGMNLHQDPEWFRLRYT